MGTFERSVATRPCWFFSSGEHINSTNFCLALQVLNYSKISLNQTEFYFVIELLDSLLNKEVP